DRVDGEPAGQVFIGNATFIDGARPDVATNNPNRPLSSRAGWGYLLLTNMLPHLGTGAVTFYAYADDVDGHSTLLGTKTVTCATRARKPCAGIHAPAEGARVGGGVANYGGVLSHTPTRADPPGGGPVTVIIDGVAVGSPGGWTSRSDLTTLFSASEYPGIGTALGVFGFDSAALADGVHTIAWTVTDDEGHTAGIGGPFFPGVNGAKTLL